MAKSNQTEMKKSINITCLQLATRKNKNMKKVLVLEEISPNSLVMNYSIHPKLK